MAQEEEVVTAPGLTVVAIPYVRGDMVEKKTEAPGKKHRLNKYIFFRFTLWLDMST